MLVVITDQKGMISLVLQHGSNLADLFKSAMCMAGYKLCLKLNFTPIQILHIRTE